MRPEHDVRGRRLPASPLKSRSRLVLWLLVPAVAVLTLLSFWLGQYPVGPGQVLRVLADSWFGTRFSVPPIEQTVVLQVRLPEVLGALLVGAALAASGAGYQTMLRNPLVSPEILGVASGAAFGGAIAILAGLPAGALQVMAFAGGMLAAALALGIARAVRGVSPTVLVLAGVVISTLFTALISATEYFANPNNTLPEITFWLFGSLDRATTQGLEIPAAIVVVCLAGLVAVRWPLTVLAAGDDEARVLGVNRRLVWAVVIGAATLMTATVISIAGVIGWVGLVVPHMARSLAGPGFGRLLAVSVFLGAGFLLAVEDVARAAVTIELPLGILTALIGAPFFVVLLVRAGRQWL